MTQYRDVVDNLTAVVAWAPVARTRRHHGDPAGHAGGGRRRRGLDAVVQAGKPSVPGRHQSRQRRGDLPKREDAPGRRGRACSHVSPHIRRAHWRRQRFGPGLGESKRIRIAPVLVNAHRGDIAPRVYRLRPREATRQTTD